MVEFTVDYALSERFDLPTLHDPDIAIYIDVDHLNFKFVITDIGLIEKATLENMINIINTNSGTYQLCEIGCYKNTFLYIICDGNKCNIIFNRGHKKSGNILDLAIPSFIMTTIIKGLINVIDCINNNIDYNTMNFKYKIDYPNYPKSARY